MTIHNGRFGNRVKSHGDTRYSNIFLLSSNMWDGNVVEYFSKRTKKLVVFYFLPRWDKKENFVRIYKNGRLIKQRSVFSPKNIFLQYPFLLYQSCIIVSRNFQRKKHVFIISYHPYVFFIQLILFWHNIDILFWVMDYFPKPSLFLRIYQSITLYFQKKNKYVVYLSSRLNKVMNNGKIMNTQYKKTVMWGIKKPFIQKAKRLQNIQLYYNGIIREEHGFAILFKAIKEHKNISIKLLGVCEPKLYKKYKQKIIGYGIEKNVYFPNRYFSQAELLDHAKECHVAVALYIVDKYSYVYYADPGKIRLYTELGLPIIMTKSSEVAEIIKKFSAGEVINRDSESFYKAVKKIAKNYSKYREGLAKFSKYFYFEKYYKKNFTFLESDYR